MVGGLDAEVVESNPDATSPGTHITLSMTVEQKEDVTADDAPGDAELKAQQEKIKDKAGSQKDNLNFLKIDLTKVVTGTGAGSATVTSTNRPLEIIVPFETSGRLDFKVYRFHDDDLTDSAPGDVDILSAEANADGEYIEVENGYIIIHTSKFSTYAIGYSVPYVHGCTSKCKVCGGCEDADCSESACKEKCRLLGMNFSDVAEGEWYTEAVAYVYHHGMMEGIGDGLFDPNGTTTRAMIVTVLWRLEGEPVYGQGESGIFADVPEDAWYTAAIEWAAANEIVNGYGDGNFGPNDDITREQFVAILWRYAKYRGYDVSVGEDTNILSYEDAFSISEYAFPAMQWACGAGLMQGDGVDLTPKADATRAQAAALFQRFCENVAEK